MYNALIAADRVAREDGIECRVVNNHTVKPMDEAAIVDAARALRRGRDRRRASEARRHGFARRRDPGAEIPVPIEFVGVDDRFGQSGEPAELIEFYGMGVDSIEGAARRARGRKTVPV